MRRLLTAAVTTALAVVAVVGFAAGAAIADAPVQKGWWTSASSPLGGAAAPDVPADGLLIEGGPSAPVAYAALVYPLASGTDVGKLTLRIAPNSATNPNSSLEVCPLDQPSINAEQGGPMTDAPAYKCDTHASAKPADGGYQFDVAALVSDGALAVAVVATDPTDRIVLSAPDAESLEVRSAAGSTTPDATTPGVTPAFAPPSDTSSFIPSPLPADAGNVGSSQFTPAVPAAPAPGSPAPAVPSASTGSFGDLGASPLTSSSPADPLAVTLVVAALAAGTAAWGWAGSARVRSAVAIRASNLPAGAAPATNVPGVQS